MLNCSSTLQKKSFSFISATVVRFSDRDLTLLTWTVIPAHLPLNRNQLQPLIISRSHSLTVPTALIKPIALFCIIIMVSVRCHVLNEVVGRGSFNTKLLCFYFYVDQFYVVVKRRIFLKEIKLGKSIILSNVKDHCANDVELPECSDST